MGLCVHGTGTKNRYSDGALTFTGDVTGTYNGSNPVTVKIHSVDDTLTKSGQATDAKSVGDALAKKAGQAGHTYGA